MASDPILRLEGVSKDYGGDAITTRVLHDVDLAIAAGEFTALIGPSGSGKSTLLNIMGLLDRPTAGRVWIRGQDTADLDEATLTRLRGRTLGFVFQFHHLLPAFSALENVIMPAVADRGRPDDELRARGLELLGAVGLSPRAHARATQLSGGQQQRVAIARALMMSPALVLADEPSGNLDTHSADEVFALLRQANQERGTAFLVVTHDPRMADRCDRIIELVDGCVVSDRPNPGAPRADG